MHLGAPYDVHDDVHDDVHLNVHCVCASAGAERNWVGRTSGAASSGTWVRRLDYLFLGNKLSFQIAVCTSSCGFMSVL